jgi:NADPH:quinone reductase-like Zn-dependent oxidoreductase
MLVAGIRRTGGDVGMLDVPGPRPLAGDEVLIQVRAAGVGNWDEFVRTGGTATGYRGIARRCLRSELRPYGCRQGARTS